MCRAATPASIGTRPFRRQFLTSDPVRYARNAAVLEAEPALGIGCADRRLGRCRLPGHAQLRRARLSGQIRQPMLIVAAGRDAVVSTPAIEDFAMPLRAGSHLIVPARSTRS